MHAALKSERRTREKFDKDMGSARFGFGFGVQSSKFIIDNTIHSRTHRHSATAPLPHHPPIFHPLPTAPKQPICRPRHRRRLKARRVIVKMARKLCRRCRICARWHLRCLTGVQQRRLRMKRGEFLGEWRVRRRGAEKWHLQVPAARASERVNQFGVVVVVSNYSKMNSLSVREFFCNVPTRQRETNHGFNC